MEIRYFFTGWTAERAFWFFGLIFCILLYVFVSLNTGTGDIIKVNGTVTSLGIDSTSTLKLPMSLVTVHVGSGQIVL